MDKFWRHGFGEAMISWAEMADHALSNWVGHDSIRCHFDSRRDILV